MAQSQDLELALRIKSELDQARKDIAALRGDIKKLGESQRDIKQLSDTVNGLANRLGSTGALLKNALGAIGIGLSIKTIVDETVRAEQALAQVEARIKATGGAAGYTAPQLAAMAAQLQKTTTVSDDAILEMQSVLLTFDKIEGDTFRRATESAIDLSVGLGQDLKSSALQLGKALQEPTEGIQMLRRAGVQFTNDQQALIQNFLRAGDLAGAQEVILRRVEQAYGGAARAARDTFGGALSALRNTIGDLIENKGGLKDATVALNDLTEKLQDPETAAAVDRITTVVIKGLGKMAEFVTAVHFLIAGPSDEMGKLDTQIGKIDTRVELLNAALDKPRALRGSGFGKGGFATGWWASDESINKELQDLAQQRAALIKQLDDLRKKHGEELLKGQKTGGSKSPASAPLTAPVSIDPALARAALDAQQKLTQDEFTRQSAALDRLLQQNLVSYRDYYARRADLQRGAIDQEIRATESALKAQRDALDHDLTLGPDQRTEALTKIKELETQLTILRKQRGDVGVKADADETQSTLTLLDSIDQVRERLASARGESASARRSALEREFRDLVARLEVEGDKEGIAIIEKLINVEVAKTKLDEVRQAYDQTLQQMQATEQDITAQQNAGLIGEIEARRRIVELHHQTAQALGPVIEKMKQAAATDEQKRQVEELAAAYRQLAAEIDPIAQRINTSIESSMANAFTDFIKGAKTASETFKSFANSVIADLQRIAAEKLAESIFQGFNLSSVGSTIAGLFHSGGVAGEGGGTTRLISPLAFLGAPRYHTGGIAGLRPDEVPAILQKGERVLPLGAAAGAGGGNVRVTVENKGTPIEAQDAQVSFDLDGMVVNIVTRDAQRGGPISNTLARTFNLRRGGG